MDMLWPAQMRAFREVATSGPPVAADVGSINVIRPVKDGVVKKSVKDGVVKSVNVVGETFQEWCGRWRRRHQQRCGQRQQQ